MSFSSSKPKTTSITETTQTSENLNIQDVEGITVADTGGTVTIFNTDMNAFDNASDLARLSVEVGQQNLRESLDFTRVNFAESFDFAGDSLRAVQTESARAGGAIERVFSGATDFVGDIIRDVIGRSQETLSGTVTALGTISREQSKSTDERVAEIAAGSQKNILLIVGIVGASLVAYAAFKKG